LIGDPAPKKETVVTVGARGWGRRREGRGLDEKQRSLGDGKIGADSSRGAWPGVMKDARQAMGRMGVGGRAKINATNPLLDCRAFYLTENTVCFH